MSYERVIRSATTTDLTIPIGGGFATTSLSLADFGLSRFEVILNVRVIRKEPVVGDVYEPSVGFNATADAIGLTLAAGTGTTLAAEVDVLGNP